MQYNFPSPPEKGGDFLQKPIEKNKKVRYSIAVARIS
jgi:hypothetical protein